VYMRPNAPRSIGGVLDDGLRLWRDTFDKTWLLAALARLMLAIPALFFAGAIVNPAKLTMAQQFATMMGQSTAHPWVLWLASLVSYLFHNAIMLRVAGAAEQRETTLGGSLNQGLRLVPRTLLFFFILVLGGMIVGLVAFIPGIALSVAFKGQPLLVGAVIGLLFVVAASYFIVRVCLGYVALIAEDRPAFESLRLSWNLTRGTWWRTTAVLTVLVVIGAVLTGVLYLAMGVVAAIWGPVSFISIVAVQIVAVIVAAFLGSLYPAVLFAVFQDLKLRKEGTDLTGRVGALASA
jgi:hypothetical protein